MQSNKTWYIHVLYIVVIIILSVTLGAIVTNTGSSGSTAPAAAPVNISGLEVFQQAFSTIAKSAAPSVVNINTEQIIERRDPMDELFREFFGGPRPRTYRQRLTNLGSGVIIRSDGYILTNGHVIADADQIRVKLLDGKTYDAKPIAISPRNDLAIIKINAGRKLTAARLGNADTVQVGSWAVAVGSPFGLSETVTVGVISAKGRVVTSEEGEYQDLLQTDASINPGNSGGPLLNLRGEVIGINQAIFSPSRVGNIGIGFAIPVNARTRDLIDRMISSTGKKI